MGTTNATNGSKHYIDTSGLAYSYNEFYTQNMPDKVAVENAAKRFVCKSATNQGGTYAADLP